MPNRLVRNIRSLVYGRIHPLSLLVDRDFRVRAFFGDVAYYGYRDFTIGDDCSGQLSFLIGLDLALPIELHYVETPNGNAAHVHVIPEPDCAQIVLLDSSSQKQAQVKMQQKANELYLLHAEQSKTLNQMRRLKRELALKNQEAEKANQLQSRFIANMSHEFRTPLTGILGFAELIHRELQSGAADLDRVNAIEREAKHLLQLVENLLDQAQIETSSVAIHPEKTQLRQLFLEVESSFRSMVGEQPVLFETRIGSIPEYVEIDRVRLRQILVNLLANAFKFTDQGSVVLDVDWEDCQLKISVTDTGCGIAQEKLEQIFHPFEKLHNRPGSGLGLSIVRHLAGKMDGGIEVRSEIGNGSCFQVRLAAPALVDNAQQDTLQAPELCDGGARHRKVLVAEDSIEVSCLLSNLLAQMDCEMIESFDGIDALRQGIAEQPDLVLMDLNLPALSGYSAIQRLREAGYTKPIFALSAATSADQKKRAFDAGCDEYLVKPFSLSELSTLVERYVGSRPLKVSPMQSRKDLDARYRASLADKLQLLERRWTAAKQNGASQASLKRLKEFAHNLSGSAGLYGYSSIASLSKQIDRALAANADRDNANNREAIKLIGPQVNRLRQLLVSAIAAEKG